MRIISGKFKGKKLIQPVDKCTRPLKDLTKESIFNLLVHSKFIKFNFNEIDVLDLFSGSGSFGIECLSRNVKSVTFVENYKPAIKILKKNINSISSKNNFEFFENNIYNKNNKLNFKKKFDLIFADPPYEEKRINELLSIILNFDYLKKNGVLILHRNKKNEDIITKKLKVFEERIYGKSKIIFLGLY